MSGQKILIVDDDISVATVVKIALEQHGYDVTVKTGALSAYKYLSYNSVDLVLLDIKMPKISGIEALWSIKSKYPDTIVIMMTAYASTEHIEQVRLLGAYGIVSKPFEIDEIRTYVGRVLSQSRSSKI